MNTFLKSFWNNHTINEIFDYFNKIKNVSVLVVGDTIQDVYQYGETLGKSGKSPIVAFEERSLEIYDGGVLAIYNHLKDFVNVDYLTGNRLVKKRRFIQGNQKLFETYSYDENNKYKPLENEISGYDVVLIADFGHGFITKQLQDKLESEAKYIALNTQLNAGNMGLNTINKYTHRNYISIDNIELRLATSNSFDSIEDIVRKKFTHETVSVTESKQGVYLYRNKEFVHIPAFAETIVDTVGAGDSYLSLTTPLAYIQAPLDIIGFIGNIAGAIACGYPGNSQYMNRKKMEDYIRYLYDKI